MKVSIVTSVLNGAKHLPRCMESVASQTYPCEHVIVDGGSTDGSQNIVRQAGSLVIEASGSNISEAFNIGIQNSSGEIIGILNADDWLERDAVERSITALQKSPQAGFTYGNTVLHYLTHSITVHPRVTVEDLAPYATKQMLFYHISSFVRRSVYAEYGLFDQKFKVAMDYDFYARITTKGVRGVYVEGVIAHALAGGVSSSTRARMQDYYQVLSRYHGKFWANYYIAKYTVNSFLYELLPLEHDIWLLLNSRSNRQLFKVKK
jgi:glycosyltransferase involved in cell wall biosynthesis